MNDLSTEGALQQILKGSPSSKTKRTLDGHLNLHEERKNTNKVTI